MGRHATGESVTKKIAAKSGHAIQRHRVPIMIGEALRLAFLLNGTPRANPFVFSDDTNRADRHACAINFWSRCTMASAVLSGVNDAVNRPSGFIT